MEGGKLNLVTCGTKRKPGYQAYTDTDTACVRPLRDWPGIHQAHADQKTMTDAILSLLPGIPELLETASNFQRRRRTENNQVLDVLVDQMNALEQHDPSSLIVALEHDHWASHAQDWRELGHSRGMQFVQVHRSQNVRRNLAHGEFARCSGR